MVQEIAEQPLIFHLMGYQPGWHNHAPAAHEVDSMPLLMNCLQQAE
jgi:hypothetical protein